MPRSTPEAVGATCHACGDRNSQIIVGKTGKQLKHIVRRILIQISEHSGKGKLRTLTQTKQQTLVGCNERERERDSDRVGVCYGECNFRVQSAKPVFVGSTVKLFQASVAKYSKVRSMHGMHGVPCIELSVFWSWARLEVIAKASLGSVWKDNHGKPINIRHYFNLL